ncbi:MAG TPA: hypothetical protein CFH83_02900 [Sulfuricurvum kujiense]|uniref:Uncharacterized protein n=1 Tax=Sulfuricurvum kujiense TaxID=148813 RepID=A0A2D3WL43_9BACT|nr:MAG TPA: hypothetical protein CFH83_02900 [Sulfuricurvum kujiense]
MIFAECENREIIPAIQTLEPRAMQKCKKSRECSWIAVCSFATFRLNRKVESYFEMWGEGRGEKVACPLFT